MRRRLSYHWIVFGAAFVILMGAAGTRSAPGVLIDPLRDEFGWSRATVGTAVSINVLLFGFVGPFAAALQQRFGLRRVTAIAMTLIAIGALLTTRMTSVWQLYLTWGVLVGVGSGCMASVFASTVASRWFVARRGLVTGALTAATASGQLIFLPVLSRLADVHGWRWVGGSVAIASARFVPRSVWARDESLPGTDASTTAVPMASPWRPLPDASGTIVLPPGAPRRHHSHGDAAATSAAYDGTTDAAWKWRSTARSSSACS